MMDAKMEPTVHVVDDAPQVRESLSLLAQSAGLKASLYASAEEFLACCQTSVTAPACLVLDVRMPGLSGLGLQRELAARCVEIPIIMISGYADVPTAVQAMGAGALDFLEKPFSRQTLLQRILEALDRSAQQRFELARRAEIASRVATLSSRERDVMNLLVAGKNAKHIAAQFGIGEKTVLKHRSRVFDKLKVDNIAELVRIVLSLGNSSAAAAARMEAI